MTAVPRAPRQRDRRHGLGLAYGAAGVLYALHATGAARDEQHEQWLVQHATAPPVGTPLGLYAGLHGVAYVLDRLGRSRRRPGGAGDLLGGLRQQRDHLGPISSGASPGSA